MTPHARSSLRNWLIAIGAIVPAVGWGMSSADGRYVHQTLYAQHIQADSMKRIQDSTFQAELLKKIDSTNLRLQQIKCGQAVNLGCR